MGYVKGYCSLKCPKCGYDFSELYPEKCCFRCKKVRDTGLPGLWCSLADGGGEGSVCATSSCEKFVLKEKEPKITMSDGLCPLCGADSYYLGEDKCKECGGTW